jgi:hypothetical protein
MKGVITPPLNRAERAIDTTALPRHTLLADSAVARCLSKHAGIKGRGLLAGIIPMTGLNVAAASNLNSTARLNACAMRDRLVLREGADRTKSERRNSSSDHNPIHRIPPSSLYDERMRSISSKSSSNRYRPWGMITGGVVLALPRVTEARG